MTTPTRTLNVGDRIYNRGDVCNPSHFGTITEIKPATRWGGEQVVITPDEGTTLGYGGEARGSYTVPSAMINHVDLGNGRTRIVTEAAYKALREKQIAEFRAQCGNRA